MSALLEQFKEAVRRKDWKMAYRHCNGLNMYEMLRGLDSIDRNDLETLSKGLFVEFESGATNTPRIAYAINVVMNGILPEIAPGDLAATGQVTDAKNFLAEKNSKGNKLERKGPSLGYDGEIPSKYIDVLRKAIAMAWRLNDDPAFVKEFKKLVKTTTNKDVGSDIYATALNKAVVHLADKTNDLQTLRDMAEDERRVADGSGHAVGWAYTLPYSPNIRIREIIFSQSERTITAVIMHETAHVAGVSGSGLDEIMINAIHKASGYPRPTIK